MEISVENTTFTCTKVNIENEGPITSGCFSEYHDGREIEVCVCRSGVGQIPCNAGARIQANKFILRLLALLSFNAIFPIKFCLN